jgi:CRISPR-associated protein Csm4
MSGQFSGSGFHFGRHGLGQEESSIFWSSDSLFAAITARQAALNGPDSMKAWIDPFLDDPPACALTSAFPRAGAVRFFPTPLRAAPQVDREDGLAQKQLKRLQYVSEAIFRALLDGTPLSELYDPQRTFQEGQALAAKEELAALPEDIRLRRQEIWKLEQRPRVALGRSSPGSALYPTGRVSFGTGCGLWLGARWQAPAASLKPARELLLADLGDSGWAATAPAASARRSPMFRRADLPTRRGNTG